MKNLIAFFFALLFIFPSFAQNKEKLTLKDIYYSSKLFGKTVQNIQWKPDGSAFTFTELNPETKVEDIYQHDVATGKKLLGLPRPGVDDRGVP